MILPAGEHLSRTIIKCAWIQKGRAYIYIYIYWKPSTGFIQAYLLCGRTPFLNSLRMYSTCTKQSGVCVYVFRGHGPEHRRTRYLWIPIHNINNILRFGKKCCFQQCVWESNCILLHLKNLQHLWRALALLRAQNLTTKIWQIYMEMPTMSPSTDVGM